MGRPLVYQDKRFAFFFLSFFLCKIACANGAPDEGNLEVNLARKTPPLAARGFVATPQYKVFKLLRFGSRLAPVWLSFGSHLAPVWPPTRFDTADLSLDVSLSETRSIFRATHIAANIGIPKSFVQEITNTAVFCDHVRPLT